jgi:hypothetical protein
LIQQFIPYLENINERDLQNLPHLGNMKKIFTEASIFGKREENRFT